MLISHTRRSQPLRMQPPSLTQAPRAPRWPPTQRLRPKLPFKPPHPPWRGHKPRQPQPPRPMRWLFRGRQPARPPTQRRRPQRCLSRFHTRKRMRLPMPWPRVPRALEPGRRRELQFSERTWTVPTLRHMREPGPMPMHRRALRRPCMPPFKSPRSLSATSKPLSRHQRLREPRRMPPRLPPHRPTPALRQPRMHRQSSVLRARRFPSRWPP